MPKNLFAFKEFSQNIYIKFEAKKNANNLLIDFLNKRQNLRRGSDLIFHKIILNLE